MSQIDRLPGKHRATTGGGHDGEWVGPLEISRGTLTSRKSMGKCLLFTLM